MSLSAGIVGVRADQVDAYGRVISPSFLNEIMEDLPEWTDLPVRVNGTEELIPSNPSVPVTSPILADILYPDIRRDDQYFTYRESPTTVDGLAKIKSIKGNTLVWNQLISEQYSHTFTAGGSNQNVNIERIDNIVTGHKYLYAITQADSMSSNVRNTLQYLYSNGSNVTVNESNATNHNLNAGRYGWIFTAPSDNANNWISLYYWCHTPNVAVTIKDAILVDLTLMFGAGNEPTTADEFTSLFPLPYYSYESGKLLSFNGTGIKTTGKNLCTRTNQSSNIYNAGNLIRVKQGQTIYWGGVWTYTSSGGKFWPAVYSDPNETNKSKYISYGGSDPSGVVNSYTAQKDGYLGLAYGDGVSSYDVEKMMISFAPFTINDIAEYTETITTLPISTYFPSGLKSAGNVYDELTPSKAVTRIGAVDLGTLDYVQSGEMFYAKVSGMAISAQAKCIKYDYAGSFGNVSQAQNGTTNGQFGTSAVANYIFIHDSTFSDANAFKTAMNGVYLYYELATPVELPTLSFE